MAMREVAGATTQNPLRLRVAAEVRAWRGRHSMTQKELGMALGLSQAQVSSRLRGETPITLDEIDRLAEIFGCTTDELLGHAPKVASAQTRPRLRLVTDRIHLPRWVEADKPHREHGPLPRPVLALVS